MVEKSPNQFSKLWIKTPDLSPDTMAPLGASTSNSEQTLCLDDQKAQKMSELLQEVTEKQQNQFNLQQIEQAAE